MKLFVVALCLIAACAAAPSISESSEEAKAAQRALPALDYREVRDDLGQYEFSYTTAEGVTYRQRGKLVPTADSKAMVLEIEGEVSFYGDDGKLYVTKFSAGKDGSKMEGEHLHVAPAPEPIPEHLHHDLVEVPVVYV